MGRGVHPSAAPALQDACDEQLVVWRNRFDEARQAGLTVEDAYLFAVSGRDVGELRKLVKAGCPVAQLRAIGRRVRVLGVA